jgi:hypothetical protein
MLRATGSWPPAVSQNVRSLPGVAGSDDLDRLDRSPIPELRSGEQVDGERRHLARADFGQQCRRNRDLHRVCTVSSTSSTGPSKLIPSRTLVRASRSRARTAEAASAVGGGPLTPSASTSGSRPTRATCSATEPTRSGYR